MSCDWKETDGDRKSGVVVRRYYQPSLVISTGLCGGILLDRCCGSFAEWGCWISTVALLTWFICYRRNMYRGALFSLFTAMVLAGAAWHGHYWSYYPGTEIGRYLSENSQPVCLEATACTPAMEVLRPQTSGAMDEITEPEYRLEVDLRGIRDGFRWRPVTGRAVVSVTGSLPTIQCGDRLRLWAHGQRISTSQNPGQFSLSRYYRGQRILVRFTAATDGVQVIEAAEGKRFGRLLERIRQHAIDQFDKHLPPPQAALASAILIGQRGQLAAERRELFMVTGTLHLLVVSGFHVGILASGVWLLGRLGLVRRQGTLWIVIGLTVGYAILTGGRPPVTRATTLAVVLCGARLCGRPVFVGNTISFAALVLLVRNPTCLFDPGTQLSFLAVLALIGGLRRSLHEQEPDQLEQLIRRSRPWFQRLVGWLFRRACQLTWLSLLIWGTTAPLVLYHFHVFSYTGILLNLVLYVPMVLVMFSGLGVWILGSFPLLAQVPAWICRVNLVCIEQTVEMVEGFELHCWGPGLPVGWLLVMYLLAAIGFYFLRAYLERWYHCLPVLLLLVGSGVIWPLTQAQWLSRSEGLRCTFIAVGHGTCVLLEMPDGQNWLYDAGAMGRSQTAGHRISALLWSRGIDRLDMVVLSHADADHYNALPYLLERFDIRVVGMTARMADQLAGDCPDLQAAIDAAHVPIRCFRERDGVVRPDGVEIEVLHPPSEGVDGNDNANSLVMIVQYQGEQILLPGDLEGNGLERLLASDPRPCSMVMAPHHGSVHSDPARFANWSQPEWLIMSTGRKSKSCEVTAAYRARGAKVWSTADHGAVTISIGTEGKRLNHWR